MIPVSIVIVNFQTSGHAIACLRSLLPELHAHAAWRLIVVDSGSGDGSTEALRAALAATGLGARAELLALPENPGLAAATNAAIARAYQQLPTPLYVLLLDPASLARPGALATLVEHIDERPHVGIAGSRAEDAEARPRPSAFRFPGSRRERRHARRTKGKRKDGMSWLEHAEPPRNEAHATDWIFGPALAIRRAVFDTVGLLDDGASVHFEADFCHRARRAGWETWYVPESRFVSAETCPLPAQWLAARRRYYRKNHGRLYAGAVDLARVTGHALHLLREALRIARPGSAT